MESKKDTGLYARRVEGETCHTQHPKIRYFFEPFDSIMNVHI
jgi:hypothetical protein